MEFTEKETQKYNGVSKQDLIDFKNREVVYQPTQSSCLGSENAVLTLENERVFNEDMNKFFERLRNSKRISDYEEEAKQSYFYKWILVFLSKHQATNKAINYIYEGTDLNHLKEASIILFNQETAQA